MLCVYANANMHAHLFRVLGSWMVSRPTQHRSNRPAPVHTTSSVLASAHIIILLMREKV